MIINFNNIGNTGGGGGGYVLPTATANRLGGIKVGSGLTITNAGVLSADEATVIDLAVLSAMTSADRIALWDEVYAKVNGGKSVFIKGLVLGESDRTAILPVVSFRPETTAATHEGGNIFFGAKGDTDNIYFHINFGSDGSILPIEGMAKTAIAKTAGAETLGMVKVGSGLSIDANGVLSAAGGGGGIPVVEELPETGMPGETVVFISNVSGYTFEDIAKEDDAFSLTVYFEGDNDQYSVFIRQEGDWAVWQHAEVKNGNDETVGGIEYRWVMRTDWYDEDMHQIADIQVSIIGGNIRFAEMQDYSMSLENYNRRNPGTYQWNEAEGWWDLVNDTIYFDLDEGSSEDLHDLVYQGEIDWKKTIVLWSETGIRLEYKIRSVTIEIWFTAIGCTSEPGQIIVDTWYIPWTNEGIENYDRRYIGEEEPPHDIRVYIDPENGMFNINTYELNNLWVDNSLVYRVMPSYYVSHDDVQDYIIGQVKGVKCLNEDDGEGNMVSNCYFTIEIPVGNETYMGKYHFRYGELGDSLYADAWGPVKNYVDITIDITDQDDVYLVRDNQDDADSIYTGVSVFSWICAVAGVPDFELDEHPIHVHYRYSGLTVENGMLLGQEDVDTRFTQYGVIDRLENVEKDFPDAVFAEVFSHVPVPTSVEVEYINGEDATDGIYAYINDNEVVNKNYYLQMHVDYPVYEEVYNEELGENESVPVQPSGDLRSDVNNPNTGPQFKKDLKDVWIAVDGNGMYDSGNSIYTLDEFGDAMGSRNLDENPIRFYYSGITGYLVEDFEYGKIQAITRNPNAQTSDYDNFGFSFTLPCGDNVYLCKSFLEVTLDGQGNKTGYSWSSIGKDLLYSLGNPN